MTHREYLKHTAAVLVGKKVRTLVELSNGNTKIPKGTVLEIKRKKSGFTLTGPQCGHCGISPYISRVAPGDVALLEAE